MHPHPFHSIDVTGDLPVMGTSPTWGEGRFVCPKDWSAQSMASTLVLCCLANQSAPGSIARDIHELRQSARNGIGNLPTAGDPELEQYGKYLINAGEPEEDVNKAPAWLEL